MHKYKMSKCVLLKPYLKKMFSLPFIMFPFPFIVPPHPPLERYINQCISMPNLKFVAVNTNRKEILYISWTWVKILNQIIHSPSFANRVSWPKEQTPTGCSKFTFYFQSKAEKRWKTVVCLCVCVLYHFL